MPLAKAVKSVVCFRALSLSAILSQFWVSSPGSQTCPQQAIAIFLEVLPLFGHIALSSLPFIFLPGHKQFIFCSQISYAEVFMYYWCAMVQFFHCTDTETQLCSPLCSAVLCVSKIAVLVKALPDVWNSRTRRHRKSFQTGNMLG